MKIMIGLEIDALLHALLKNVALDGESVAPYASLLAQGVGPALIMKVHSR